jgi:hypothetical protein
MTVPSEDARSGGCLCGAVRYTVRGRPLHVGVCHCADCRKESGSVFTVYAQWPLAAFELTGDLASYDGRSFCARCGSRLLCLHETDVEIRAGSLDDAPTMLEPLEEIWVRRREHWLEPIPETKQHEQNAS